MMTPLQRRLRAAWKRLEPARQAEELRRDFRLARVWHLHARDEQLPPAGPWTYWLILAGRGFGKTRTGAEWVRRQVRASRYVNLIGATADDARDIMIEGESGILAICPRDERPQYKRSERKLLWPNGAISLIFTADEPERLRGKQHEKLWCDELAAWRYPEAWDQAKFGLRLGSQPQACLTTTPKPTKLIKELAADPHTHITRGTTYDNRLNLAPGFYSAIIKAYENTRLGRQELDAEILDDNPGALWSRAQLEALRVAHAPALKRIVVGVDPAVTANEDSDLTGIVVAGLGEDDHGYVLADRSLVATPSGWSREVVNAYHDSKADRVVAEINNGGDLVELAIRTTDRNVSYKAVRATRGKIVRAEPIAALYEQGRIHHVGGFPELEDQMCGYDALSSDPSPDRMDALVWAFTELFDISEFGLLDYYRSEAGREKSTYAVIPA
jgi:phage terminase large subunit-like protein